MEVNNYLNVEPKLTSEQMEELLGKCPGESLYDTLLTEPTRVTKPGGQPLCVYLPGALTRQLNDPAVYEVLHDLRKRISRNRGKASGSQRFGTGRTTALGNTARTYSLPVASAIAGAIDPTGQQRYCRLTSWTGRNLPQWSTLHPLLRAIDRNLCQQVPDRAAAQYAEVVKTDPAWVVSGTPFSTITVNNSYATGIHTDSGDLDAGFSTIACLRRGTFTGGRLVFPQYGVAVDMHHGDLILMDAHEYHGNTLLTCSCGVKMNGMCGLCEAERISLVAYFRTKLTRCGSPQEERAKAEAYRDHTETATMARLAARKQE